jgi:hypothetical protein
MGATGGVDRQQAQLPAGHPPHPRPRRALIEAIDIAAMVVDDNAAEELVRSLTATASCLRRA